MKEKYEAFLCECGHLTTSGILLPCGHIICNDCLTESIDIEDETFMCPVCGEAHEIVTGTNNWDSIARRIRRNNEFWNFIGQFESKGLYGEAEQRVMGYFEKVEDVEEKTMCFLKLGQIREAVNDSPGALKCYLDGIALNPVSENKNVAYLLYNNSGACYNRCGMFSRAEKLIRKAININPNRYDAFENLGISLEGQGRLRSAAEAYSAAEKLAPSGSRAKVLLKQLREKNPGI
jgi:tetratricopeptide (TPR) repeat protein